MSLTSLKNYASTGVDGLDYEHGTLIELIEAIAGNFEDAEAVGVVSGWFGELYATVSAHFALEEVEMRKREFPDYDAHKAHHEYLLEDVLRMMDAYMEGECAKCGLKLRDCLEAWFGAHVLTMEVRLNDSTRDVGIPITVEHPGADT